MKDFRLRRTDSECLIQKNWDSNQVHWSAVVSNTIPVREGFTIKLEVYHGLSIIYHHLKRNFFDLWLQDSGGQYRVNLEAGKNLTSALREWVSLYNYR